MNITRRPLSPVHNLDQKKLNVKRGNNLAKPNAPTKQIDNKFETKGKGTQPEPTIVAIKSTAQISSHTVSENENINESDLPFIVDVSYNNITPSIPTKEVTPSQETATRNLVHEENQPPKNTEAIGETNAIGNDTNETGSQMESTRDESQDTLLGELMIISQPLIEQGTSEEMTDQEQVTIEETEITITAIIEEIAHCAKKHKRIPRKTKSNQQSQSKKG